jgi:hypothetical protein
MYSKYYYVPVYGKNVNVSNIQYDWGIIQKTYKEFFAHDFYKNYCKDFIFIISFANGNSMRIKCDKGIYELDIHNKFKKYISQDIIEVDIKSVEIKHATDFIHGGGRKAPIVKKEINGRLRCIYKIAGSRKEHIKYKGRLITVSDYKKLMKKV